jgi:hypothetical protein
MLPLRQGVGAIGGHATAARECFADFKLLAESLLTRCERVGEPRLKVG